MKTLATTLQSKTKFSPEIELMLCCARTRFNSKTKARIRTLLQSNVDWPDIIQIATQHGVIPLLYNCLKLEHSDAVPSDILEQLKVTSHRIALNNTIFSKELLDIIDILKQNDVRAIPFKGIILAASVYGSIGLRHFCDLDILVSKKDFLKASSILINQRGYEPSWQPRLLNQDLEVSLLQKQDESSLTNGFVAIDLHQVLTAEHLLSSRFIFEDLWTRLEPVSISGHRLLSFGKEDLCLYLCVHGSKECWRNLKWICDIAEFVDCYPKMDWDSLMQRAHKMGCQRMLLLGLFLANNVLETKLPPIANEKIQADEELEYLGQELARRLFRKDNSLSNRMTLEKTIFHLRMVDKLQDKWACIWDLRRAFEEYVIKCIPNQRDKDFFFLPRPFYFFYYFVRPIRLFGKLLGISKV